MWKSLLDLMPHDILASFSAAVPTLVLSALAAILAATSYYVGAEDKASMQQHNVELHAHPALVGEIKQIESLVSANGITATAVQASNITAHEEQKQRLDRIEGYLINILSEMKKQ